MKRYNKLGRFAILLITVGLAFFLLMIAFGQLIQRVRDGDTRLTITISILLVVLITIILFDIGIHEIEIDDSEDTEESIDELQRDLNHRDSILSVTYDLVRSNQSDKFIVEMIKAVIDFECCDKKLTRAEKELVLRFRRRDF